MEAFDLERMDEYETLTHIIRERGPLADVIQGNPATLQTLAQQWNLEPNILIRFRSLHRQHFAGYMGEKRKAMVRQYAYDVKNAAHLIRLLRMGAEFLETGRLQVFRTTDADELKQIKRGAWTLEQVKAEAERLAGVVEAARASSTLPLHPNENVANELLITTHREMLAATSGQM